MEPAEVSKLLAIIKATYGDKFKVLPATKEAWTWAMGDVPYSAAQSVVADWIKVKEWPPAPANIRAAILDGISPLPTVDEAWRMVMDRIRDTYPGHSSDLWMPPDVVRQAVDDVGGLRTIRFSESPARKEREFKEAYDERRRSAVERQMRQALPEENMGATHTARLADHT